MTPLDVPQFIAVTVATIIIGEAILFWWAFRIIRRYGK